MHGNELGLFMGQGILPFLNISVTCQIAAVDTIFYVSSMTRCGLDLNLIPSRQQVSTLYGLTLIVRVETSSWLIIQGFSVYHVFNFR